MKIQLNKNTLLTFTIFTLFCLFLSGCLPLSSANPEDSSNGLSNVIAHEKTINQKPLAIQAKSSQKNIAIRLDKQTLELGDTVIKHWPFTAPQCQNCDLTISRRHYPDGPNTLIKLFNDKQSWLIAESWQKRLLINGWSIKKNGNGLTVKSNEHEWQLTQGQQQKINNCTISVLWNQTLSKPHNMNTPDKHQPAKMQSGVRELAVFSAPQISDDKPKHRMQLLLQCQK